jgi:regulator of sigma E protease
MNTSVLGGIIFVMVFAGIIILHEMGHFIAARLLGIDVEEFAVGFPPRLARLWSARGRLVLAGREVEIPKNFDFPLDQHDVLHRPVTITADEVKGKLVLRTIDFTATEDGQSIPDPAADQSIQAQPGDSSKKPKVSKKEPRYGAISLGGTLKEFHPGTLFTLNWIPLGGYNKIKGEDDPNLPGGMAAARPWKRILVLIAGVTMNLLAAVLVYTFLFSQLGIPDKHVAVIGAVNPGSPAESAGLKADDIVLTAGGKPVDGYEELQTITHNYLGKPMQLTVSRAGQTIPITVTPRAVYPSDQGPMGITIGNLWRPARNWFETIPISFTAAGSDIQGLLSLPGRIIAGTVSPQEAQIGGPRSIWNLFQQSVARDVSSRQTSSSGQSQPPTNYTLLIIISLTITVGVVNLLPIPALDGWRIFTTLVEMVIRRPIPAKYQAAINGFGFLVLLILLGFFYIKDFINPINITLP